MSPEVISRRWPRVAAQHSMRAARCRSKPAGWRATGGGCGRHRRAAPPARHGRRGRTRRAVRRCGGRSRSGSPRWCRRAAAPARRGPQQSWWLSCGCVAAPARGPATAGPGTACVAVEDGLQAVKHASERRGRPAADLSQIDRAAGRGQQQRGIAALHQHLRGNVLCRAGHVRAHPRKPATLSCGSAGHRGGRERPVRDLGLTARASATAPGLSPACGLRHGHWVGQQ